MKFMCRPAIVLITIFLLVRLVETSFLTLFYPPYVTDNHSLGYPWDWMSLQTWVHLSMLPFLLYLGRCLSVTLFFSPFLFLSSDKLCTLVPLIYLLFSEITFLYIKCDVFSRCWSHLCVCCYKYKLY